MSQFSHVSDSNVSWTNIHDPKKTDEKKSALIDLTAAPKVTITIYSEMVFGTYLISDFTL